MYQNENEPTNRVSKGIEARQTDGVLVIRDATISSSAWILSEDFEEVRR